ncbi:MAG: mechanosensitive ion channel domain-containing protein [Planctomycetota bacterium]
MLRFQAETAPTDSAATDASGAATTGALGFDPSFLADGDWWLEQAAAYAPRILLALAVYLIGRWVAMLIVAGAAKALRLRHVDETLTRFLSSALGMSLTVMVVIAALGQLGVKTTSFVAILGAATLAIGFALQDSLGSLAAGVMLILFRPFRVGDYIEGGGTAGIVEEINIFHTMLRTPDNKQIVVPNARMTGDKITNYSTKPTRRIDLIFGCSYGDDLLEAKTLLMKILKEEERVLAEPAPMVGVHALGDSSVNFAVRPWVKASDYWDVYFALQERVKLRFDAAGLSIPFPQRDVHIHTTEGDGAAREARAIATR